jgi:hypothetical protein
MKRLLLRVGLAALTFTLGVAAAVLLRPSEDAFVSVPVIYEPLFAPVASSEVCEVHRAVMRYESVPRHYLLPHLAGTLTHLERNRTLYPNAHRKVGDFYMVGDEERFTALVCPACSFAEVEWIHHPERR